MKLIIDIDKELKSEVYRCGVFLSPFEKEALINAINNGTPIPDSDLNEAVRIAYQQGRKDALEVLDKIRDEILNFKEKCNASDYLGCGVLDIIDKYKGDKV